jgi:adenosyl cobinamide kinase/adenosyl cobinamide phosphate guanylyltransferase
MLYRKNISTQYLKAQQGIIVPVPKTRSAEVKEHAARPNMSMGSFYRKDTAAEIAAQREQRIAASQKARAVPWTKNNWRERMAAETAATADKLSLQQLPVVGKYIPNILDVTAGLGSMASALGSAPLRAKQENSLMPYVTAVGMPLIGGAVAGLGAKTTGQFVNNMVNPLAGTGSIIKAIKNKVVSKITGNSKAVNTSLMAPKKAKILLPSPGNKSLQEIPTDNKKLLPWEDDFWEEGALEPVEKIVDSRIQYDDIQGLMKKHGDDFSKKYGTQYTEKDLSLFAKMEAINKERLQTQSHYSMDTDIENSNAFIDKHGLAKEYTPMDELLTDAYTKGYDSRMNNRIGQHESQANSAFYKKEVTPKLEELIKKNKLKSPEILYRGESDYLIKKVWRNGVPQPKNTIKYSELQQGDVFKPGSFLSTSISKTKAGNFGKISSEITAPAGQSVLFPNATGVRNFFPEKEILLPRKLKYRVDEVIDKPLGGLNIYGTPSAVRSFRHSITNPYLTAGAIAGTSYLKNINK